MKKQKCLTFVPTNKKSYQKSGPPLTLPPLYTPLNPSAMFIYKIIKVFEPSRMQYLLFTFYKDLLFTIL